MRLQVNFRSEESEIPDAEPFELEGLTRYQLNQQLLNTLVEEDDAERLFRRFGLRESCLTARLAKYSGMRNVRRCSNWQAGSSPAVSRAKARSGSALQWRSANRLATAGTGGWIIALASRFNQRGARCATLAGTPCLLCQRRSGESRLFLRKEGEWRFPPLDKTQAMAYPAQLIEGYREGMSSPLLVLPESGGAWIKACYDAENDVMLDDDDTLQKAGQSFYRFMKAT